MSKVFNYFTEIIKCIYKFPIYCYSGDVSQKKLKISVYYLYTIYIIIINNKDGTIKTKSVDLYYITALSRSSDGYEGGDRGNCAPPHSRILQLNNYKYNYKHRCMVYMVTVDYFILIFVYKIYHIYF